MHRPNSILTTAVLSACVVTVCGQTVLQGQTPSSAVMRLTVMVRGLEDTRGSGFVIGDDPQFIYVATAGHVVGLRDQRPTVWVRRDAAGMTVARIACEVLASSAQANVVNQQLETDVAVLKCPKGQTKVRFFYDVVGDPDELKRGAALTLIGDLENKPWNVPLGYLLLDTPLQRPAQVPDCRQDLPALLFANPLGKPLNGASGGPLLTDRSEFLGIVYDAPTPTSGQAHPWPCMKRWIMSNAKEARIKLSKRARSAPALRTGNLEFSAALSSVLVPEFGWLTAAPKFRVAAALPNLPSMNLAFDFTFTQATKEANGFEKLSLAIPAVTAEYQLGSALGILRRHELLGGIYIGVGIAPVFLRDTLQISQEQSNIQSWTGVFDAGWRYRFPGRNWGLTAAYREGILFGETAQALYPRFRSVTGGVFVVFR